MALSNFPKTFGIRELKKGFFAHFFNTKENQNYGGYMPDKSYYDPDGMSPSRKEEFLAWYDEKVSQRYIFNFQHELLTYCQSDVRLLNQGCVTFQSQFKEIVNFNPMQECTTIASACNVAYRKKWMPAHKIAVEPVRGWRPTHNQSHLALEWLYWEEKKLDNPNLLSRIAHVDNKGERTPTHGRRKFLVDGYDEQTVYEFQGCFYHGCLRCFPNRRQRHPIHLNKTMYDVREDTRQKIIQLNELGYRVCEMWECEWNRMKNSDAQIKQFVDKLEIVTPLNPREAFFSGRINAIKLHHKIEGEEKIYYNDMTSYPCAHMECKYPVGHPDFIDQPDAVDICKFYGLAKCKVLPPYNLYHPVLPHRQGTKLLFPLCKTCAEIETQQELQQRTHQCNISAEERALIGTWTTIKLEEAVKKGYITYIYEVWHFKEHSDELFQPYIKTFLKIKQEASGWPPKCETGEKKRNYLQDYEQHEGIQLDYDKVQKNPGLRSLAKLMLNSFWGKFGQRLNQTQVTTCTKPYEFLQIIQDDQQVSNRNSQ